MPYGANSSTAKLVVYPDGEVWRREGECDGCRLRTDPAIRPGQCCRAVTVKLDSPYSEDAAKWVRLHPGLSLDETREWLTIDTPCSALDEETGACLLYESPDRPELCRKWPRHPTEIEQSGVRECAYTFELVRKADGCI